MAQTTRLTEAYAQAIREREQREAERLALHASMRRQERTPLRAEGMTLREKRERAAVNRRCWGWAFLALGLIGGAIALAHFLLHCGGPHVIGC